MDLKFYRKKRSFVDIKINDKNPSHKTNHGRELSVEVTKNAGIFQSKQEIETWTKNLVKTFLVTKID